MSDGEPGRMTGPPLSVPKIRFCNNGDEVRRGRDVRSDHGHPCSSDIQFAVLRLSLTEIIKPGHSQQSLSGAREGRNRVHPITNTARQVPLIVAIGSIEI